MDKIVKQDAARRVPSLRVGAKIDRLLNPEPPCAAITEKFDDA